jgi:hypothetical protein
MTMFMAGAPHPEQAIYCRMAACTHTGVEGNLLPPRSLWWPVQGGSWEHRPLVLVSPAEKYKVETPKIQSEVQNDPLRIPIS